MKKIVITGATGFIGGFIAEAAVKRGWQVYISARKTSDLRWLKNLEVQYIDLNLESIDQMASQLDLVQPDFIIHNAGLTKAPNQETFNKVNAIYTENLALAAMKLDKPIQKFVFMSSLASYGPADNLNSEIVHEDCTPFPVTMYGKSKLLAEQKIKGIVGLPYIMLRPTAVYGPREKDLFSVFKIVSSGLSIYSGNGRQKLTFVHVSDLVEWVLRCTENNKVAKSYFVSDGKTYSPTELNSIIAQNLGKKTVKFGLPLWLITIVGYLSEWSGKISGKLPALNADKLHEIKANNWQCNVAPLMQDTGFQPQFDLREGIAQTVKWYKENNWL